jgi:hypothetical protein
MTQEFDVSRFPPASSFYLTRGGYPATVDRSIDVRIAITRRGKQGDFLRVEIGEKVLEELGWKLGDKITPLVDPSSNTFAYRKKTDSDLAKGVKIGQLKSKPILHMTLKEGMGISLGNLRTTKVEHEVIQTEDTTYLLLVVPEGARA